MSGGDDLLRIIGTGISETIEGGAAGEVVYGLAGDDVIAAKAGDDLIFGDYAPVNLLDGTNDATSFAQYGETGAWRIAVEPGGHASMTQTIETKVGEVYAVSFGLAANYGSGTVSGAVEVLWNGVVIDSFGTNSASFTGHEITFEGVDGPGELTFRSIESTSNDGPVINTDGPIFYYEKDVEIGGQTVEVKAFAEAQSNIYQVMNGTLQVFDPLRAEYVKAGVDATVTINGIGFNVQDDLIYGSAVSNGVDSLGNAVQQSDIVMMDASGASFRIGSSPYRSWTGDFDGDGNLWLFNSSMDWMTMVDVDQVDADGRVASTTFKMPKEMITDQLWDVAYNDETKTFAGVTRPKREGEASVLYEIDISAVSEGGEPVFRTTPITSTLIDGEAASGAPAITFGAAIYDAEGNLYVGGNSGDHDMNDATSSAGGIYLVATDDATGEAQLQLISESPKSRSNDGTADPRAADPFAAVDREASVLIRKPTVVATPDPETTYDDRIEAGAGADEAHGGFGADVVAGEGANDRITGGAGDDSLFGGSADMTSPPIDDYYDDAGVRYDADGNVLPENNDVLIGDLGSDFIHGSAGNDTLDGGEDGDELIGGSGLDVLIGGEGDDQLSGGSEADEMRGGSGSDDLIGGSGKDQMFGGHGDDELRGGADDDMLDGGGGDDLLDGGVGDDVLIGGTGADTLKGSTGNDHLSDAYGENELFGGSGHDVLIGGADADMLNGGSGDDELNGGGARDVLKGGKGDDVLIGGGDKDKLYGGSGADKILGGDGSDYINASNGDDMVDGGQGKDKILLGKGADVVSGGADADWFVFRTEDVDGSVDTILDFTCSASEKDRLDFRAFAFTENGATEEEWVDAHVRQNADDSVSIEITGLEVRLIDHADLGFAFYDQVTDALLV
ncbi:MAG: type I secretion protein [Pseudomonadota bacterium]